MEGSIIEKILMAIVTPVVFHYFYKYVVYKSYCVFIRGTDYTSKAVLEDKIFKGIEIIIIIGLVLSSFGLLG